MRICCVQFPSRQPSISSDSELSPSSQPPAEFLREVRDGACGYFNVVLSPDYNADHHDHLHVDMGWYRTCR